MFTELADPQEFFQQHLMKKEEQPSFGKRYSVHFGEESAMLLFAWADLSHLSNSISANLMSPLAFLKGFFETKTLRACFWSVWVHLWSFLESFGKISTFPFFSYSEVLDTNVLARKPHRILVFYLKKCWKPNDVYPKWV